MALFCVFTLIIAIRDKSLNFSIKNWICFISMTSYFIILIISILYSSNKVEAFRKIIQFLPLLVIPFILSFTGFSISKKKESSIFNIFILINIVYTVFIFFLFITNPDRLEFSLKHYLLDYDKFQFIINNNLSNDLYLVHKPYFSMGFVIIAVFSLHAFIKNKLKINYIRILYLFVFLYFSFWIFYAFSFPNIIALLLCVVLVFYMELSKKVFLTSTFLFLITCIILLSAKTKDQDFQRGFNFINFSISDKQFEVKDTRLVVYKTIRNILKGSSFCEKLLLFFSTCTKCLAVHVKTYVIFEGVVPKKTRAKRSKMLRGLSAKKRRAFYESQLGNSSTVLFENENKEGYIQGFTENYVKVKTPWNPNLKNTLHQITLTEIDEDGLVRFNFK